MPVKVNAAISKATRDAIRKLAADYDSSVQAVVALTISIGLERLAGLSEKTLRRKLPRDRRRAAK